MVPSSQSAHVSGGQQQSCRKRYLRVPFFFHSGLRSLTFDLAVTFTAAQANLRMYTSIAVPNNPGEVLGVQYLLHVELQPCFMLSNLLPVFRRQRKTTVAPNLFQLVDTPLTKFGIKI